jgi:hypothetical protein
MLVLNPDVVRFEAVVWEDAAAVVVERGTSRAVEEWTDFGPHAGLVDAAEIRTTVKVVRKLTQGDVSMATVGALGDLTFYSAPTGSDAGRRRVKVRCVLMSVKTELPAASESKAHATQTLSFTAVSSDGTVDPVEVGEEVTE